MKCVKLKHEDIKLMSNFFKQYSEIINISSGKEIHNSKYADELSLFIKNGKIKRIEFFKHWHKKLDGIWRKIIWSSENNIVSEQIQSDLQYTRKLPEFKGWFWLKRTYLNGSISYKPAGIDFQDGEIYINFWGAEWKLIKAFLKDQKDLVKLEWAGPFYNPT